MAAGRTISPKQQTQILIGICGLIGGIVWVNFFWIPQRQRWSDNAAQIQNLQAQTEQLRGKVQGIPALEAEISRLKAQYEPSGPVRPPEEQLPELLRTITEIAHRSQVRHIGSKPTSDVNRLMPGESGYLEVKIMVGVVGGYHEMITFADALENSQELLRIQEIVLLHSGEESLSAHAGIVLLQAYLNPGPARQELGPQAGQPAWQAGQPAWPAAGSGP